MRHIAHSSFKFYNRKINELVNITEEEHIAQNQLLSLEDIIIQKADKGNMIVLLCRNNYVTEMENILSDTTTFTPMTFEGDYGDTLEKEQEIKGLLDKLLVKGVTTPGDKEKFLWYSVW